MNRKTLLKFILLIAVVAGLLAVQSVAGRRVNPEAIRDWMAQFGAAAPVAYILVYSVAPLFFFPGSVLTAAAGLLWGWKAAFFYVVIGSNLCANAAFWIGRKLGQERVQKLTKGKFRQFEDRIVGAGFGTILFLRLVPLVPFNVLNYGAGVTRVRWRDYFFGSLLGMLPGTFVYVYIGGNLDWRRPQLWYGFAALALLVALPSLWKWYRARRQGTPRSRWAFAPLATAVVLAGIGLGLARFSPERSAAPESAGSPPLASGELALPASMDAGLWDAFVKSYVTPDSRIRYADLMNDRRARARLDEYLASLALDEADTTGSYSREERLAALLNAYNAFTINTILEHYPTESIMTIPGAFTEPRHRVGNLTLSLDQIEQLALEQWRLPDSCRPRVRGPKLSAHAP